MHIHDPYNSRILGIDEQELIRRNTYMGRARRELYLD